MARPADSYRAVRRNGMRTLKMTWADFQKEFPLKRKIGPGKRLRGKGPRRVGK